VLLSPPGIAARRSEKLGFRGLVSDRQYLLCDIDAVKAVRASIGGPKSGPIIEYVFGQPILSFIRMQVIQNTHLILSHPTQGYRLKESGNTAALMNRRIAKLYQAIVGKRYISATVAGALFRPKI
jgi:hypothetical protein